MDKPNQLFKAFANETRLRILNLVAQREPPLLRTPQCQVIGGTFFGGLVDQGIEVGVFHAELDQAALWRMQVVIHESAVGA